MMIEIGGESSVFCAAHAGLHDGRLETLHGHTFRATLRLYGCLDEAGMVMDFQLVKKVLAAAITPLRRRTLMPVQIPGGYCKVDNGQVIIECGDKHYSFPAQDVALLPVVNTTTEALAAYLLDEVTTRLWGTQTVGRAELTLAESPGAAATASVMSLASLSDPANAMAIGGVQ